MSIVNKHNAVVGYVTLKVGKRVARKKAQQQARKIGSKVPFRHKKFKR
ncbi:MAG TPA: hypothetical protein VGH79_07660 [Gaiellaceae bacterium]|jgi:hypothetical protein